MEEHNGAKCIFQEGGVSLLSLAKGEKTRKHIRPYLHKEGKMGSAALELNFKDRATYSDISYRKKFRQKFNKIVKIKKFKG